MSLCTISNVSIAEERRIFVRDEIIVPYIDIEDKKLRSLSESLMNIFSVASGVQIKPSGELNFYLIERDNILSNDEFRSRYLGEKFGDGFSKFYSEGLSSEDPCYTRFFVDKDVFVRSFSLIDQSIEGASYELCVAKSIALAFGFYTNEPYLNIGEFLALSIPYLNAIGSCRDSEDVPKCVLRKIEGVLKSSEIETKFFGGKK